MVSFAKSILIAILVSSIFLLITNLIFFIPWYMTLVYETFNLAQAAAVDNYVKETVFLDTENRLKRKPIFKKNPEKIVIEASKGEDNERYYLENNVPDYLKPYKQRGEPITVKISASYPLRFKLGSTELSRDLPVSFSFTTTGLKYYKDLDFYGDVTFTRR